jgi:pyrroloquinoline quinone (PQQ) biosynthesis protein C
MQTTTDQQRAAAMEARLQNLAESVFEHEALNNEFYERWMEGPLSPEQVKIFARNYLARTVNTATMVALSVISTDDVVVRVEIVKNLFSEYGYGDPAKAHIVLLEQFMTELLSRLEDKGFDLRDLDDIAVLPTTTRLIEGQRQLYTDPDQRIVLGTLLAQEWLAYSMLTRLYEGGRNYKYLFATDDEFHEHCEYFYCHIGDAEKDHKEQAIKSAAQICHSTEDLEVVETGFATFVELTADYWRGIAEALRLTERSPSLV